MKHVVKFTESERGWGGGEYHWGEDAWSYVKLKTDTDLKAVLEKIAEENAHEDEH